VQGVLLASQAALATAIPQKAANNSRRMSEIPTQEFSRVKAVRDIWTSGGKRSLKQTGTIKLSLLQSPKRASQMD
jgi:hypothetical protein